MVSEFSGSWCPKVKRKHGSTNRQTYVQRLWFTSLPPAPFGTPLAFHLRYPNARHCPTDKLRRSFQSFCAEYPEWRPQGKEHLLDPEETEMFSVRSASGPSEQV